MKIEQQQAFKPITITLETEDDALHLWDLIIGSIPGNPETRAFAANLSNWFSNCAQFGDRK